MAKRGGPLVRMRGWTGVWSFLARGRVAGCALADAGLDGFFKACLGSKEGPYQDRPPLCPFRL